MSVVKMNSHCFKSNIRDELEGNEFFDKLKSEETNALGHRYFRPKKVHFPH